MNLRLRSISERMEKSAVSGLHKLRTRVLLLVGVAVALSTVLKKHVGRKCEDRS